MDNDTNTSPKLSDVSNAVVEAQVELQRLACERDMLDGRIHRAIKAIRAEGGTWQDVGWALGISRQAAQQAWGKRV